MESHQMYQMKLNPSQLARDLPTSPPPPMEAVPPIPAEFGGAGHLPTPVINDKAAAVAAADCPRDARGYKILQGKERSTVTAFAFSEDTTNDLGRSRATRIRYIEGLRGILGLQTLLYIFFRIFAPAICDDRDSMGHYPAKYLASSPEWMHVVRKVLSPLLFDGSLQSAFFIILIGRASMQTYIERRVARGISGPCFRRPFRLAVPVAITFAVVSALAATNGFKHAAYIADTLNNDLANPPKIWSSALEYWNSVIFYFMSPLPFKDSRAVQFIPPAGMTWFIQVAFKQTYVMVVFAWCIPYVTLRYKMIGLVGMTVLSAWVARWSWYTLTGLTLAELSVVYQQLLSTSGGRIPLNRRGTVHVRGQLIGIALVLLGAFFKYFWAAVLPQVRPREVLFHSSMNAAGLNYDADPYHLAIPRYDDWFVCTGVLLLIEMTPALQRILSNRVLVHAGKLSFSIALIGGTIMLSAGGPLFYHLTATLGWTDQANITGVMFAAMIPSTLLAAEIYARLVDDTSLWLAKGFFRFSIAE